jgi:serine phosphatase RsbU (regulator of sigma subunit)
MHHSKRRNRCQCESRRGTGHEPRLGQTVTQDLLLGAKEVHEALCAPASQRIGNFDTACATVPARHISGDFVVSFELAGSWFLALGDLMGKGLSAAMWLTHVLDLLRCSCETGQTLPCIMQSLNRQMHCSRLGVPLTSLFLARLDPATSRVTYSCGGCPPGFLLASGQAVTMLQSGGPILGAMEQASYSSSTIDLELHDTLLVASDGISEVLDGIRFELRPGRVADHLKFTAGDSAASIVQSLLARVRTASPTLSDDLSLMAVQRVA